MLILSTKNLVLQFFRFVSLAAIVLFVNTKIASAQQIRINEVMSANQSFLADADGDFSDWFELYNVSDVSVNLSTYSINDDYDASSAWQFPDVTIDPNQHLMLFASGKDQKLTSYYWRTIIDQGAEWKYLVPTFEPSSIWNTIYLNDERWDIGPSGFGYGDNDDATELPNIQSIYLRKTFTIENLSAVKEAILHMDYDDAFVAYINGEEIARANITSSGPPAYNALADNSSHEARMYQGGMPDEFIIDLENNPFREGENVLAIQVHNAGTNSSDLSAIPFLTLAFNSYVEGTANPMFQFPQFKLHTDFKLSADGESLYLFNNGALADSLQFPSIPLNYSFGRNENNPTELGYFNEPTPEAENANLYSSIPGEVYFSRQGGIIEEHFDLTLSSDNTNDKIYYTTDGTPPSVNSNLYTGPLSIDETTMLRASILNANSLPGFVYTQDYYFDIHHDVPIISLVTDPANFFDDYTGIYVNGAIRYPSSGQDCDAGENYWQDWERPVHVSMINPDGTLAFEQNAGVKIFGGCSRRFAQKSMTLKFRKEYGKSTLKYKVFDDLDIDEFTSLNLRNSGNDWNQTMMRDGFQSKIFPENIDKQAFQPAVVYINGEYWGIHNIRERIDDEYIESHYDVNNNSVNMMEFHVNWRLNEVRGDGQTYFDLLDFIENNDLGTHENYQVVKNTIDVANFAMYQACNIAVRNTDWPGNNLKFWSSEEYDNLWRWITYDLDFGFADIQHNTLTFALQDNGPNWPNPPESTYLLRKLMVNREFQSLFINAFCDLFNTQWTEDRLHPIVDEMKEEISSEIFEHMQRWGGDYNGWENRVNYFKTFASQRPAIVKGFLESYFTLANQVQLTVDLNDDNRGSVELNTLALESFPWTGDYYSSVPVTAIAKAKKGYHFVMWTGAASSFSDTVSFYPANNTLRAVFAENIDYTDQLVINEVFFENIDDTISNDWVEIYNARDLPIDVSGFILKDDNDNHRFVFPENTIVQANSYLVVAENPDRFKTYYDTTAVVHGGLDFGFGNPEDCVRLYDYSEMLIDSIHYYYNNIESDSTFSYQRFETNGVEEWIAVEGMGSPFKKNEKTIPDNALQFEIAQNSYKVFPNPVRNTLTVNYTLANSSKVEMRLIDRSGKIVAQLEKAEKQKGSHQLVWNETHHLLQGMYILEIETNQGKQHFKVVKL